MPSRVTEFICCLQILRVCRQTTTSISLAKHSLFLLNGVKSKDCKKALVLYPDYTSPESNRGYVSLEKFFNSHYQANKSIFFSNLLFIVKDVHFIVIFMKSDLSIST